MNGSPCGDTAGLGRRLEPSRTTLTCVAGHPVLDAFARVDLRRPPRLDADPGRPSAARPLDLDRVGADVLDDPRGGTDASSGHPRGSKPEKPARRRRRPSRIRRPRHARSGRPRRPRPGERLRPELLRDGRRSDDVGEQRRHRPPLLRRLSSLHHAPILDHACAPPSKPGGLRRYACGHARQGLAGRHARAFSARGGVRRRLGCGNGARGGRGRRRNLRSPSSDPEATEPWRRLPER